jgi:hypothetical protein
MRDRRPILLLPGDGSLSAGLSEDQLRDRLKFDRGRRSLWFKVLLVTLVLAPASYVRLVLLPLAAPQPTPINEENFARIKAFMWESEVEAILGDAGLDVTGRGWPRVVGEVPNAEKLDPFQQDAAVRWMKWTDRTDPNRWIAVGFVGRWGAIAKRKSGF